MAAPNGNPIVFGANRAVGDRTLTIEQELALTLQAETLAPFQQQLKIAALCPKKMISGGKNYQWIVHGKVSAGYRTSIGAYEIGNDSMRQNEITVGVDREIVSKEEVHEYDEFAQWWDIRQPIVTEIGRVLGRANDQKAARALFVSAATDMPAGSAYTDISGSNDMRTAAARAETVSGLASANRAGLQASDGTGFVTALDDISVKIYEAGDDPSLYRLWLSPTDYMWLAKTEAAKEAIDRDFNSNAGDLAMRKLPAISSIQIDQASAIGTAAFTNTTYGYEQAGYERNDYINDNSAVAAVVARVDKAIAGVGFYDLRTDVFWDPRTDTHMFRGKTCVGYGALESQCAYQIKVSV